MAGLLANFNTIDMAIVAATAKTVIQFTTPTNQRAKILSFSIFFKDTVATDTPVDIQFIRQTAVIGGTPTALTAVKNDNGYAEAVQCTAAIYGTSPTEPAGTQVRKAIKVHPQSGYEVIFPYGQELIITGGGRLGIVVTAAQAQTCTVQLDFEE